jgi:hypothetical protein
VKPSPFARVTLEKLQTVKPRLKTLMLKNMYICVFCNNVSVPVGKYHGVVMMLYAWQMLKQAFVKKEMKFSRFVFFCMLFCHSLYGSGTACITSLF